MTMLVKIVYSINIFKTHFTSVWLYSPDRQRGSYVVDLLHTHGGYSRPAMGVLKLNDVIFMYYLISVLVNNL